VVALESVALSLAKTIVQKAAGAWIARPIAEVARDLGIGRACLCELRTSQHAD
jgi:hypothetical protein